MDKIKKYEKAILSIVNEYAKIKYANVDGGNYVVADKKGHHYQVVTIGWNKQSFVHHVPMHFDIINGKIWVQRNDTEWELGQMLERQGVPKSDMVIGFLSPSMRELSDYAVG